MQIYKCFSNKAGVIKQSFSFCQNVLLLQTFWLPPIGESSNQNVLVGAKFSRRGPWGRCSAAWVPILPVHTMQAIPPPPSHPRRPQLLPRRPTPNCASARIAYAQGPIKARANLLCHGKLVAHTDLSRAELPPPPQRALNASRAVRA